MTRENRGKKFEEQIKKAFEKVPGVSIDRIHDQMSGFSGSQNACDFVVYRKPYILYLECKTVVGNTLPFTNITDNQWRELLKKSDIDGVIAGVMVWFQDHDCTTFIPIQALKSHKDAGDKSVNIKTLHDNYGMNDILVPGEKKRIFFDYNMEEFLKYIKWLEEFDPNELGGQEDEF